MKTTVIGMMTQQQLRLTLGNQVMMAGAMANMTLQKNTGSQVMVTTRRKLGPNVQLTMQTLGQGQSVIHHGLLHLLKAHVLQVLRQMLQHQQLSLQQSLGMRQQRLIAHHKLHLCTHRQIHLHFDSGICQTSGSTFV
jgi:hypothetical protein